MSSDNPSGSDDIMTSADSRTRVQAYRSRLSGQFKRVEAYVTQEERERIQAVRQREGSTMDVTVAGLLRLGLEQYERERQQPGVPASPAVLPGARPLLASCAPASAVNAATSANAQSVAGACAPVLSHPLEPRDPGAASESPVSRFFRARKDFIHANHNPSDAG